MSTQEFYIRGENDTEARGPFTQDQLSSLVEAQQVDPNTLYYDAALEQWVPVASNASLMVFLFPEKKRLRFRSKDDAGALNTPQDNEAPIRVEDMLAAAEGRTTDTFGKGDPALAAARVAAAGRYALLLMLALSVCAMLVPRLDAVYALEWVEIATDAFILIGLVDVFFVVMLLLGATAFYPALRFRAVAALGFFGVLSYFSGDYFTLLAVVAGSVGMYVATIAIQWAPLIPAVVVGLAGTAALAFLRVFA